MPTASQLIVVALIAGLCAAAVATGLHLFGYGEHAVIGAAVAGASSASTSLLSMRGAVRARGAARNRGLSG